MEAFDGQIIPGSIRPNLDRPDDDRAEISQAVQSFTARRIQKRLEAQTVPSGSP